MSLRFQVSCVSSVCGLLLGALGCGTQPITIGEGDGSSATENVASAQLALGATSSFFLADGASTIQVSSIAGGAVKAPVVSQTVSEDGVVKKRIGLPQYEPVTIPAHASSPASYIEWADAALRRSFPAKSLTAQYCDANRKLVFSRAFSDSTLTALVFGPFDAASSKMQPLFTQTFTPTTTVARVGDSSACKGAAIASKGYMGNFVFELGQLDATGVTKIDEIRLASSPAPEGGPRELPIPTRPYLSIPSLRVYVSERRVDSWQKWFNDFVVKGRNDEANELSGQLELTSSDGSPLLTLEMHGVGISRLASPSSDIVGNDLPSTQWVAELYVERMSVSRPAP
jgi:hypothetical protein